MRSQAFGANGAAAAAPPALRPGAGGALGDAAAELGAGEAEGVTQHPEERGVGRDVDRFAFAVDGESDGGHERASSRKYGKKRVVGDALMEGGAGGFTLSEQCCGMHLPAA